MGASNDSGAQVAITGVAQDTTLTGGMQKSIARSGAKGSTVAADVTSTSIDANTQGLDVSVKGTVPVSGTVGISGTVPVSGTVGISGTVPVSAAALPLPSGAAQDSTLTGGTQKAVVRGGAKGGTAAADVTSTVVDANTQGLDVSVKGTVPVSVAAALPITDNNGSITVDGTVGISGTVPVSGTVGISGTVPVSAAALPLPSGAAQDSTLTGGAQKAIARGGAKGSTVAADVTSTPVDTNTQALDVSVKGTVGISGTVPVSGTVGISGTTTVAGTVSVSGTTTVAGTVGISGTVPVSAAALPLPANAAQEHVTAASPHVARLSDGAAFYDATKTGQLPAALVGGRLDDNIGSWLGSTVPTVGQKAGASSIPVVLASDQGSIGKTSVLKTGTLATTAVTADQVILTYTVTAGKTFHLEYIHLSASRTVIAAAAAVLGLCSVETPSGTKIFTCRFTNPTTSEAPNVIVPIGEPIPIAAGIVIRVVCTPADVTSTTWIANLGGYER